MPRTPAPSPPLPKELDSLRSKFLAFIRVECGLSDNTIQAYDRDLCDLFTDLSDRGISSAAAIGPRDLANHLSSLKTSRKMESSSITRHLATIKVFGRWLTGRGFVKENPAEVLERPHRWKNLPGVMSVAQLKALLAAPQAAPPVKGEPTPLPLHIRDRAMLELMYASGLRASEVGAVCLSDLHESLAVVRLTGKGRKQRLVPVGKPAMAAIKSYLADCRPLLAKPDGRDKGRMLLSRSGRPLERVAVWQIVKRHAAAAGLRGIHPHMLRHARGYALASKGADTRAIQAYLGHKNIQHTVLYTQLDPTRFKGFAKD